MSQVSVPLKYIYGSHRNANESFAEKREIKKKRCWARGSVYTGVQTLQMNTCID